MYMIYSAVSGTKTVFKWIADKIGFYFYFYFFSW